MKYANDLLLTELARQITNALTALNADLRDGYLDSAFLRAQNIDVKLEKLQERLNDIRYGRVT